MGSRYGYGVTAENREYRLNLTSFLFVIISIENSYYLFYKVSAFIIGIRSKKLSVVEL